MKTIYFDIETTALRTRAWGLWDDNAIKMDEDWKLLCFAWKEPGGKVFFERRKGSEKALVKKLWKVLDGADKVVAHNGKKFDIRKANAKFLEYGLRPPSFYFVEDTYSEAKRYFALTSYKLDALARLLGLPGKVRHDGFETWEGCEKNDPEAWRVMEKYNRYDVELLEKVHLRLIDWIRQKKPKIQNRAVCPYCKGTNTQRRGERRSKGKVYEAVFCKDCHDNKRNAWSQDKEIIQKI